MQRNWRVLCPTSQTCADPEKFLRAGGGGGGGGTGVQIPRRGLLKENFNMAKINNLAIPRGGVGGVPDPLSPLWIRPCQMHEYYMQNTQTSVREI